MDKCYFAFILLSLFLLLIIRDCECLKFEPVEEGPCIVPPVDLQLDFFWIANIPEFYYPIISKYALYKYAVTLSGKPIEDISEEMAHNSCQLLNINTDAAATISGFGRSQKTTLDALITDQGVVDWVQKRSDGTLGYRGRTYTTLTDNDKYVVAVSCFEAENQKSYEVVAREKTLDEASKSVIKDHLKSLGFDLNKSLLELKYDNCYSLPASNTLSGGNSGNTTTNNPANDMGNNSGYNSTNSSINNSVNSDKISSRDNFGSSTSIYAAANIEISSTSKPGNKIDSVINNLPQPSSTQLQNKVTYSNQKGVTDQIETVIRNTNNISTLERILYGNRNIITSATSNGQVPQNVIIIYNNDAGSTTKGPTAPPAKKSEYRNSADIFFDIVRTVIDFVQNAYKNGVRYLFLMAQRVIGQFNSFRKKLET